MMDIYKIPIINKVLEKQNKFDYIQIIPKGLDCYILVEYNNIFVKNVPGHTTFSSFISFQKYNTSRVIVVKLKSDLKWT